MSFLNREEAILVLREIFDKCTLFDGTYLSLVPPNVASLLSQGYQVHIKIGLDDETRSCMQDILEKHGLALNKEEKKELVIIFKPKKWKVAETTYQPIFHMNQK